MQFFYETKQAGHSPRADRDLTSVGGDAKSSPLN